MLDTTNNTQDVDCNICENRGKVHGLSQETYCYHCIQHYRHLKDYFKPIQQGVALDKSVREM